jgi:prophage antirepressor-like protein
MIKKTELLYIKQFNNIDIHIYGSYDEPMFEAQSIGEMIGIKNVKEIIDTSNFMNDRDIIVTPEEVIFLTEHGLYKLVFKSNQKDVEHFREWVCEVVKEIRLKGKYDLEEKLKQKELEYQKQSQELLRYKEKTYEEIEKTGHLYVIKTDGGTKVGKTKDTVTKRIKGLQTGNVNNIEIILDFPTSNPDLLEKCVHYILDRYRCNSNREFFDCDVNYIKTIVNVCGTVIDTLKSSYQHISQEELVDKLKHNGIEVELEVDENQLKSNDYYQDNDKNHYDKEQFHNINTFQDWLGKVLVLKRDGILNLKDICQLYLGKTVSSRISCRYKIDIENYIKKHYKELHEQYKDTSFNGERVKGWIGLSLKT